MRPCLKDWEISLMDGFFIGVHRWIWNACVVWPYFVQCPFSFPLFLLHGCCVRACSRYIHWNMVPNWLPRLSFRYVYEKHVGSVKVYWTFKPCNILLGHRPHIVLNWSFNSILCRKIFPARSSTEPLGSCISRRDEVTECSNITGHVVFKLKGFWVCSVFPCSVFLQMHCVYIHNGAKKKYINWHDRHLQ